MQPRARQRFVLFLIIGAFLIPMIAAYVTYLIYQDGGFRTTNRGTFVEPPVNVEQLDVSLRDGHMKTIAELTKGEEFRDRWVLAYVAPANCDAACLKIAYYINQLYLAMGKNTPHLLPLMIQPQSSAIPSPTQPEVTYATATVSELGDVISRIPVANRPDADGAIYLIDPHGFLMMYYSSDEDPDNILKDLQHLIRS